MGKLEYRGRGILFKVIKFVYSKLRFEWGFGVFCLRIFVGYVVSLRKIVNK